jgi:hypothetical protein
MVITHERKKELMNMILKKAATGTFIGLGIGAGLYMLKRKGLAALAMGYTIGVYLQSANQELINQAH